MLNTENAAEPFILFELAGTTYAVPSAQVQQLEMLEDITPVPGAPAFVEGVVLLRGQVVPVVDLRRRFGFPAAEHDLRTRLIVVTLGERRVGLIVDSAREFITIPNQAIQPPPEAIAGISGDWLAGVANLKDRLILILDLQRVLTLEEQAALQAVELPGQTEEDEA